MSERACRNTAYIGCPGCEAKLVCYRPRNHPGNCYDAQEAIWWHPKNAMEPEPRLVATVGALNRLSALEEVR